MEAVSRELTSALKQYDEQAAGPSKYKRVAQFLLDVVFADGVKGLVVRAQAAAAGAGAKLATARKEATEVCSWAVREGKGYQDGTLGPFPASIMTREQGPSTTSDPLAFYSPSLPQVQGRVTDL